MYICLVTRLYRLPVFSNRFFTIHEVAEPHTITITSSCLEAHLFQKSAKA